MNRRKQRKPGVLRIDTDSVNFTFDNDEDKKTVISIVEEIINKSDYDPRLCYYFEYNEIKYRTNSYDFAPDVVYIEIDDFDEWDEAFADCDTEEDDTDYGFYDRLENAFWKAVDELCAEGKL